MSRNHFLMGPFCLVAFCHPPTHFLNSLLCPWRVNLHTHIPTLQASPGSPPSSCSGGISESGVPWGKLQQAGQAVKQGSGQVRTECESRLSGDAICIMELNVLKGEATGSFSETQITHLRKNSTSDEKSSSSKQRLLVSAPGLTPLPLQANRGERAQELEGEGILV